MSDLDGRTATDRWLGSMGRPDSGEVESMRGRANEALQLLARLRARVEELEQVSGDVCPACGWAGIRGDDPCAFCCVAELEGLGGNGDEEHLRRRLVDLRMAAEDVVEAWERVEWPVEIAPAIRALRRALGMDRNGGVR